MNYSTKYKIEFADLNKLEYTIEIQQDDYIGSITKFEPAAKTLSIEYPVTDIYEPLSPAGATIEFYNNGVDVTDLYTINPFENRVLIKNNTGQILHTYYISEESYNENYANLNTNISITLNDGINGLNRKKYFTDTTQPQSKGREKISNIINECLIDLSFDFINVSTNIYHQNDTNFTDILTTKYIDLSNFIDEDGESMSKKDVLFEILKSYGLVLKISNNQVWIYAPNNLLDDMITFKQFTNDFSFEMQELYIPNKLILNEDFYFVNKSQEMEILAGFSKIIFNYSPYSDEKKLIPFDTDFSNWFDDYSDFLSTTWVDNYSDDSDDKTGYYFREASNFSLNNVVFNNLNGGAFFQIVSGESTETPTETDFFDNNYFGIINYSNANIDDVSITINGGYINPLSSLDNNILMIKFKAKQFSPAVINVTLNMIKIPYRLKVGDKYAQQDGTGHLTLDSLTPVICWAISKDLSNDIRFKEMDFYIQIEDIEFGGNFVLEFMHEVQIYDLNENWEWIEWNYFDDFSSSMIGIRDFSVECNYKSLPTDDIEYISYSSIDFSKEKKIELNISDKINGELNVLNRGVLTNNDGSLCSNWKFKNDADYTYSLTDLISRIFLSQFGNSYRRLTATISTNYTMFEKYGNTYSNVIMPFSTIKDVNYQGDRQFLNVGGSYNVVNQLYNGTFDEIKEISEDY